MDKQTGTPFNELEIDVIQEIASIGAGHAATALSTLLSSKVLMSVPSLRILSTTELVELFGDPERPVVATVSQLTGDVNGSILYIIDKSLCRRLLRMMRNKTLDGFLDIDAMDQSALTEISNIVTSSYVNAIAETTRLQIRITPPQLALDMIGAVLNYPLQVTEHPGDQVLFIEDTFTDGDKEVSCYLLILLESNSLEQMMRQMGVSNG